MPTLKELHFSASGVGKASAAVKFLTSRLENAKKERQFSEFGANRVAT
ncbi:MAG: hypothetical protein IJ991_02805 [Thermoguttaceae bacterium]|nr:hypothetical protein [Thermoguttaceae bacterium]